VVLMRLLSGTVLVTRLREISHFCISALQRTFCPNTEMGERTETFLFILFFYSLEI
jgi:hypothetical protein